MRRKSSPIVVTPHLLAFNSPSYTAIAMADSGHVLLLPYPSQGHIHPMLQFAKRIAARGPLATLAATRFILRNSTPDTGAVRLAAVSDGCDAGGYAEAGSVPGYLDCLEKAGSRSLDELLCSEAAAGRPVSLLVFDAFLPWAGDVGRRRGVPTAAFFTQAAAVDLVYLHVWEGRLEVPVCGEVELPGLPRLQPRDLPSFLPDERHGVYPAYLELVLNQFKNLEKVDEVLINTFHELEAQEMDYMKSACGAKSVGPTIPSLYLDNRLPSDSGYGFHLYTPEGTVCTAWLDAHPPASVVYASFGSMSSLSPAQMSELASALAGSGKPFLWVVRSSEASKLPCGFAEETAGHGLVVGWSPQLEVLAHAAVGCFLTHCGWNSTVEALSLGVPVVAMPQWTDQPTDAKYAEDVWEIGLRAREEEGEGEGGGLVRREEVERCLREVMEGGRSGEIRRNAAKWRALAKAAVAENGSSDRNTAELVSKYCNKKTVASNN